MPATLIAGDKSSATFKVDDIVESASPPDSVKIVEAAGSIEVTCI